MAIQAQAQRLNPSQEFELRNRQNDKTNLMVNCAMVNSKLKIERL